MYQTFAQLSAELKTLAQRHPAYLRIMAAGKSPEGREIWLASVTEQRYGERQKPALVVDANVHAGEVTGSAAAMALLRSILQRLEDGDEPLAALFEKQTLLVLPRVSVDGAERFLTTPQWLRSVPRLYPLDYVPPGLQMEDIDGDGSIRRMRLRSPFGRFRPSRHDDRVMLPRQPGDSGPFYEVLMEGRFSEGARDGQEARLVAARHPYGLDLNRNYPAHWQPSQRQPGSGRFPLSEPETQAVASVLSRPEVYAYLSLHTAGGVLLRPPAMGADDGLPLSDLLLYRHLADIVNERIGWPTLSTREAFSVRDDDPQVKGADDWAYEHFGILAYTMELWNLPGRAGARCYAQQGVKGLVSRSLRELEEDLLKEARYVDEVIGQDVYRPWSPFEHPDLGQLEIGGYDPKFVMVNPPEKLLGEECEAVSEVASLLLTLAPDPQFGEVDCQALGDGLTRVRIEVGNSGLLGTGVTEQGLQLGAGRLRVQVTSETGRVLQPPTGSVEIGPLCGSLDGAAGAATDGGRARLLYASFVVQAPAGSVLTAEMHHPMFGLRRRRIVL